jgi:hypothetical protein
MHRLIDDPRHSFPNGVRSILESDDLSVVFFKEYISLSKVDLTLFGKRLRSRVEPLKHYRLAAEEPKKLSHGATKLDRLQRR